MPRSLERSLLAPGLEQALGSLNGSSFNALWPRGSFERAAESTADEGGVCALENRSKPQGFALSADQWEVSHDQSALESRARAARA